MAETRKVSFAYRTLYIRDVAWKFPLFPANDGRFLFFKLFPACFYIPIFLSQLAFWLFRCIRYDLKLKKWFVKKNVLTLHCSKKIVLEISHIWQIQYKNCKFLLKPEIIFFSHIMSEEFSKQNTISSFHYSNLDKFVCVSSMTW